MPVVGDACRYSTCNDGYQLSTFGTDARNCIQHSTTYDVYWDGSAKTCESESGQYDSHVLCSHLCKGGLKITFSLSEANTTLS